MALYTTFVEEEGGAEGYAAAVTRDQARILWDCAKEMTNRSPEFQAAYGVRALANAIVQERSASKFVPISSDAKALDGLNMHFGVCDEIASHKTSEVYDVLLTAMGKRRHPMLLSISTATNNIAGIGKQLWNYAVRVLAAVRTPVFRSRRCPHCNPQRSMAACCACRKISASCRSRSGGACRAAASRSTRRTRSMISLRDRTSGRRRSSSGPRW
jgi:hypothetical protein